MLQKAPPLRQESSSSVTVPEAAGPEIWSNSIEEHNQVVRHAASESITSSGLVALKTTADALEELQGYREEVKNLLLKQGCKSNK